MLDALADGWPFSSLVIVNSDGSLLELLCLRRLLVGPWKSLGDVCRDRLRDPCELDGVAPFVEFIKGPEPGWYCEFNLCWRPCRSVAEGEALACFTDPDDLFVSKLGPDGKTPIPGSSVPSGRAGGGPGAGGPEGACVLWSSVIMIEFVIAWAITLSL